MSKEGVLFINYQEDKVKIDPFSKGVYLTPFEFSTLAIIDMEGNRITDFRSQPTMTAGQDEFLGLYVVVSKNPRRCEYVVRSVGGKPIQAIQWQSSPASTHVLYLKWEKLILPSLLPWRSLKTRQPSPNMARKPRTVSSRS